LEEATGRRNKDQHMGSAEDAEAFFWNIFGNCGGKEVLEIYWPPAESD